MAILYALSDKVEPKLSQFRCSMQAAKLMEREIEDIAAVQSELSDKVEELQDVLEQHLTTKNALQVGGAPLRHVFCILIVGVM